MANARVVGAAVGGLIVLAGCGAGGGNAPPSGPLRPAVAVEDRVGAIDRTALVGRWSCREMNPLQGRQPLSHTVELRPDGKGHNSALVDIAQQGGPLPGRMAVDFTYDWQVQGERVTVSNERSTVRAADGNPATGLLAGIAQAAANTFSSRARPGTMDVLRLDGDALVMRVGGDSADFPVLDCARA